MLISVITPSYNQVDYLETTIKSVLAQDYKNLDYIIIDGGSTDGSVDIIKKYADQLSWWISEPDQGQADGINKGFKHANGEIVAWLNSDDLYLPGAISSAITAFKDDPDLGMVFGRAITIDHMGRPLNRLSFGNWKLQDLMRFRIICQPAVFMQRTVLEQVGYLDEKYHYMLDHHLWLRIAKNSEIKYVDQLWAAARHHSTAKNVAQPTAFADEVYKILDCMEITPEFSSNFKSDRRKILGGANRLAGRYLLDGGLPGPSILAYAKALFYWPSYALLHWGRIIFAFVNLFGIGTIEKWSGQKTITLEDSRLKNWPGINLGSEL